MKRLCSDSPYLQYAFYYLPENWLGGGSELELRFDEVGICDSAEWGFSQ
jgi:hypothetical protein